MAAAAWSGACEPYRELIEEALGRGRNAMAIWPARLMEADSSSREHTNARDLRALTQVLDACEPRHARE
jgi:hypothetical protein